jgi:hypothetical protein
MRADAAAFTFSTTLVRIIQHVQISIGVRRSSTSKRNWILATYTCR